jgi:hypothetical protein
MSGLNIDGPENSPMCITFLYEIQFVIMREIPHSPSVVSIPLSFPPSLSYRRPEKAPLFLKNRVSHPEEHSLKLFVAEGVGGVGERGFDGLEADGQQGDEKRHQSGEKEDPDAQ